MAATDATLVRGVLDGDRTAFAELYDRRARLIRAICFDTTRDLETAAELTQEVFLRALQKLAGLRDPQRFVGWLAGIARQVCHEWLRGRSRQRRMGGPLGSLPAGEQDDPLDERTGLLLRAIAALPERERLSLQAFYLQDLDPDQACQMVGVSRATLYRALAAARAHLRKVLTQQEMVP